MIAIIGATGHTGTVIADRLLHAGEPIRVLGRSVERLQPFVARGADAAVGDVHDAAFLTRALRGADAVYALLPPDLRDPDPHGRADRQADAIARAVQDGGVRHVVFLSSLGADQPSGTGPILGIRRTEARLQQVPGISLVLLRAGYFYENVLSSLPLIAHQGINGSGIAPDTPLVWTASHDIGLAAAEALQQPSEGDARVVVREVLGPRDLTMREITRIIGERIGRPDLPYVQFSDTELIAGLVQAGVSEAIARLYGEMSHALSDGRIRSLAGRTPSNTGPTTFEAFTEAVIVPAYRAL